MLIVVGAGAITGVARVVARVVAGAGRRAQCKITRGGVIRRRLHIIRCGAECLDGICAGCMIIAAL